mmetsp:Transcript_9369/g.34084  ORF Transcript_9369/g.34084 Transcript_9369/m.34084 type:complete len:257 (-) Transcript_9369:374-1144(-)|eukprot:30937-Pelagococcus_subviridis.AAC.26
MTGLTADGLSSCRQCPSPSNTFSVVLARVSGKFTKYCPNGKSNGVIPSSSPHRMSIGHLTSSISSSGLGPGGPVRILTNARNAPGRSAASHIDATSASSTLVGSLYTPRSAPRTFSSPRTPSNTGFATASNRSTKSMIARTTLKTGTTALYCHPNPSKSPGRRFTLLFIPPAQLRSTTPATRSGAFAATCNAASDPIEFPTTTAGAFTTSSMKCETWSLQNSISYGTSGWSDRPNPRRSSAYTLFVFASASIVSRY